MALLLHAIDAAGRRSRRLVCRLQNPHLVATLSGLTAVGAVYGIRVCTSWIWPALDARTPRQVEHPAPLDPEDWLLYDRDGEVEIIECGSGNVVRVEPIAQPIRHPTLDPLLARRLLGAYARLREGDARTIALYGAGSHTSALLRWGIPDALRVSAVIVSDPHERTFEGISVVSPAEAVKLGLDAVLLSSRSFESDMLEEASAVGLRNVMPLYADRPAAF